MMYSLVPSELKRLLIQKKAMNVSTLQHSDYNILSINQSLVDATKFEWKPNEQKNREN